MKLQLYVWIDRWFFHLLWRKTDTGYLLSILSWYSSSESLIQTTKSNIILWSSKIWYYSFPLGRISKIPQSQTLQNIVLVFICLEFKYNEERTRFYFQYQHSWTDSDKLYKNFCSKLFEVLFASKDDNKLNFLVVWRKSQMYFSK